MSETVVKPLIGTLYVDPGGNAYRLRDWGYDWMAMDEEGAVEETVPNYAVMYVKGGMGSTHELPEGSDTVWTPDLPGWEPVDPIAGGHKDVWRCLAENCGAFLRLSDRSTSREAHDSTFHEHDKPKYADGCIGQHTPETNPICANHIPHEETP